MNWLDGGGVDSPAGVQATGLVCGIKKKDGAVDLAIVRAGAGFSAAGVFTANQVRAAPVVYSAAVLGRNADRIAGVVVNGGNANAVTGQQGMQAAELTAHHAAEVLRANDGYEYLVMSTGVIGVQLPLEKLIRGLDKAVNTSWEGGGKLAAEAIMTTDTVAKQCAVEIELADGVVTIGGMAKGAGMIHPDMATMLACVTTDAALRAAQLESLLARVVTTSFNRISIDGDTSTNDTLLLMANSASGVSPAPDEMAKFEAGLLAVCQHLAKAIVRDGEGASKFITIQVTGAHNEDEAYQVANTIATSPLVKTAFYGEDANWGRVLAAAGRSGVQLEPRNLALWFDNLQLLSDGAPTEYLETDAAAIMQKSEITVRLDLALGQGEAILWTCDLSHDYVSINASYRT